MKLIRLIKSSPIKYFLFAAAVAGFFTVMQFVPSQGFSDPDGYYHAGAARLISEGKLEATFPWAYFSTLRQDFGDQHYLYHLLLIPMSSLRGMHVSVVVFSSLMVLAFVWLLRRLGVKYAMVWGIFLLGSSVDFLFRINVVKANTLSLVLLFAAVWLLAKQKYIWLIPLSALFVWVYGGFVFLPVVAGAYVASYLFIARKFNLKPFLWVVLGIAAGLVLHPHFPNLAVHLYYQLFQSGLGAGLVVPVGGEWNPYSFADLVSVNGLALLAFTMGGAIFILEFGKLRHKTKEGTIALFLCLTTLFFLLLTIRSRRFVEYSVPFCVMFAAYIGHIVIKGDVTARIKEGWRYWHMRFFSIVIAWVIILVAAFNITRVEGWLKNGLEPAGLKGSSMWLAQNTKPGEIIFNTKWDDLPQLFYWNSNNYYIIGLDPTFMYAYSQDLYWKWRQVADNEPEKFDYSYEIMRHIVKVDFQSSYIILENDRDDKLKSFLDENSQAGAAQVYTDNNASVYRIN
jgi:hypothetical protein